MRSWIGTVKPACDDGHRVPTGTERPTMGRCIDPEGKTRDDAMTRSRKIGGQCDRYCQRRAKTDPSLLTEN